MTTASVFETPIDPDMPVGTRVNIGEAFPGVVRPLDWTGVAVPNDFGIRQLIRDLGLQSVDPPGSWSQRLHRGRAYINLSWVYWQVDGRLPGARPEDMEIGFFGSPLGVEVTRPPRPSRLERTLKSPYIGRAIWRAAKAVRGADERLQAALNEWTALNPSNLTDAELVDKSVGIREQMVVAAAWHSRSSLSAQSLFGTLRRLLDKAGVAIEASTLVDVLSDLGEVESAGPAKRIRELAQRAQAVPGLADELRAAPAEEIGKILRQRAPAIDQGLTELVSRYGYRSGTEYLITAPSWAEDPTPVLKAFQGLASRPMDSPGASARSRADAERQLLGPCARRVREPARLLLRAAQAAVRAREATKATCIIRVDMERRCVREAASRLYSRDRIESPADVCFLTIEELEAAVRGSNTDLSSTVRERSEEAAALEASPEPAALIDGVMPLKFEQPSGNTDVDIMHGIGVCAGLVEGHARVAHTLDDLVEMRDGEILVAPYTDAGWTPYFTIAGAVVVATGGLMSHCAVVAREVGVPAIVNATDVLQRVRTGDRVRVDADAGTVQLLH